MMFDCSKCIECEDIHNDDNMTPDAFGDTHAMMCDNCLFDIKRNGSERYLLVKTEEYSGITFIHHLELDELMDDMDGEVEIIRKLNK